MSPNQGQVEAWNGGESVHHVTHADGEREQAVQDVRSSLAERHEAGAGVTLGAAAWLVSARN